MSGLLVQYRILVFRCELCSIVLWFEVLFAAPGEKSILRAAGPPNLGLARISLNFPLNSAPQNLFLSSSTARPPTQIFNSLSHSQLSWRLRCVVKIRHHFKTIVTRAPLAACCHDMMMTYRWEHDTEGGTGY
jgi:hypothetical protein